jgi:hypothetical protein
LLRAMIFSNTLPKISSSDAPSFRLNDAGNIFPPGVGPVIAVGILLVTFLAFLADFFAAAFDVLVFVFLADFVFFAFAWFVFFAILSSFTGNSDYRESTALKPVVTPLLI